MTKKLFIYLALLCTMAMQASLLGLAAYSDPQENLLRDLLVVDYWNKKLNERYPVLYNHFLQGGYLNMPSSRMGAEGEIGFGYSHVPPYRNYNLRAQILDRLEVSGNYRIFRGIDDPILSPYGFGDLSDKGANLKLAIFHPEDSHYVLPGIAIGIDDFIGTRSFQARYVVATQVFMPLDLEVSVGYGGGRIKGFFAGANYMPFRKWDDCWYLKGFSACAEYDPIPYRDPNIEKHPKGRKKKSYFNWGFKYRVLDQFDFSLGRIRGDAWAWSASTFYNFGETKGFLPKLDDPLPYAAPINTEPLGELRPEASMVQDFVYAMKEQGFDILEIRLYYDECGQKTLRFVIDNYTYALEKQVRERLNYLLAALVPDDIDTVIVVIDDYGLPIQQYNFYMTYVRSWYEGKMGQYELRILSPLSEVAFLDPCMSTVLFNNTRGCFNFEVLPKTHSFFGSSRGKFKYCAGLNAGVNGFLPGDVYYSVLLGCIFFSNLDHITGIDRLNPSRLINVRTDIVKYYQQHGVTVDEAYLQKNWNLGRGWFSRLSLGYFEEEYGGLGSELLYYPINCNWAIGIEGAVLKKRSFRGLGFTNKIRKLDGWRITHKHFLGSQYFVDLYYDWKDLGFDMRVKSGKFLANDWGARFELTRHFPSRLRVTIWYTLTNGRDKINGARYHDKGISFSMPLDIFYTCSDRDRWNYGLSAWLRDVGVSACTGDELYNLIYEQRNNH